MRNYERVLKILDLCEEIVTFKAFKDSALDILSNIKECVVAGIDNAKKWIVNAVNEANEQELYEVFER